MATSIGAVLASKRRKHIIRAFKKAGAMSPESAKSLEALGLSGSTMLKIQKRRGIIVEAEPNRFYLDEVREAAAARTRIIFFAIVFVVLIVLLFLSNSY